MRLVNPAAAWLSEGVYPAALFVSQAGGLIPGGLAVAVTKFVTAAVELAGESRSFSRLRVSFAIETRGMRKLGAVTMFSEHVDVWGILPNWELTVWTARGRLGLMTLMVAVAVLESIEMEKFSIVIVVSFAACGGPVMVIVTVAHSTFQRH
jgi:hypothetical protein